MDLMVTMTYRVPQCSGPKDGGDLVDLVTEFLNERHGADTIKVELVNFVTSAAEPDIPFLAPGQQN